MTTVITYDGVASAQGGNIFQDKRFWVAQRVPMRSHYVDLIKNNGGTIVPLEKNADYLIADHARKDIPPGSFSFKLIEDSVKHGILQVEDKYRIGRDPDLPRPAGSAEQGRGSRIPFTKEDDAALVKWVLAHPTNRTGNAIYKDFEAINPRHSWQSWRNRWSKTLSVLSMDKLEVMAASAPEARNPQTESSEQQGGRQPTYHQRAERIELEPPKTQKSPTPAPASRASKHQPQEPKPEPQQKELGSEEAVEDEPEQEDPEREELEHEDPEQEAQSSPPPPSDAGSEPPADLEESKQRFYSDLQTYADDNDLSIELEPTIGGKTITLFDLATTTYELGWPEEEFEWTSVPERLGYERAGRELVAQLQHCWEDNLKDFLTIMEAASAEVEDPIPSEEEEEEIQVHIGGLPQRPARSEEPVSDLPSSPPMPSARVKRSRQPEEQSSGGFSKRRRLDRNAEIPSTPDERLGIVREPAVSDQSPSLRRRMFANVEIKDSQEDTQASLSRLRTPKKMGQTTDSRDFAPSTPRHANLNTQESSFDITPSQQLNSEAQVAGPEEDEASNESTPRPQQPSPSTRVAKSTPTGSSKPAKAVRRSLPSSFNTGRSPRQQPQSRRSPISIPDDTNESSEPSPEPQPKQQQPHARNTPDFNTIQGWIEHYQSMGYPHATVIAALRSTTMTPGGLASHVMESLHSGPGTIPSHHEGVWTDRDDRSLRLVVSCGGLEREPASAQDHTELKSARRERKRLVNKHGEARMALRWKFLQAQDQQDREAQT